MLKASSLRALVVVTVLTLGAGIPAVGSAAPAVASTWDAASDQVMPWWADHGDFEWGADDVKVPARKSATLAHQVFDAPADERPVVNVYQNGKTVRAGYAEIEGDVVFVTVGADAKLPALKGTPGAYFGVQIGFEKAGAYTRYRYVQIGGVAPVVDGKYPFPGGQSIKVTSKTPNATTISVTGDILELTVQQRKYGAKKWADFDYLEPTKYRGATKTFRIPTFRYPPGDFEFRLHIAEHAGVTEWSGPAQRVKIPKSESKVHVEDFVYSRVTSSLAPGTLRAEVESWDAPRTLKLQAYQGGKWLTKATKKTTTKSRVVTFAVPKFSHNKKVKIRVYATATSFSNAAASKSRTYTYVDPRKLTGLAGVVAKHIKSKCPTAPVTLTGAWGKGTLAGMAYWPDNRIEINKHLEHKSAWGRASTKAVAYHECSHLLTYRAAEKAGKLEKMERELDKVFKTRGGMGVEYVADAMANVWGSDPKHNGYDRKKFTKAQKSAAKKILAGKWF